MTATEIENLLKNAIDKLFMNQPIIYEFTPESGRSEWNLAHHLANETAKLLPGFDCDVEIIKPNVKKLRPDIILHKRGTNDSNLLVVEVKTHGTRSEIPDEINKIKTYWFLSKLCYQFGAVVHLKNDKTSEIQVLRNARHSPLQNPSVR